MRAIAQVPPDVQLEVDTSSTRGRQSISGACCTLTPLLFGLTSVPRCRLQEAASADADLRWRAEQMELQLGYVDDSRTMRPRVSLVFVSLVSCAIGCHVAVACDGSSFEV